MDDDCGNSESLSSKSSSFDHLNVLDPDLYEEVKKLTPAVQFDYDDDILVIGPPSSDEDDFSKYLPETSNTGDTDLDLPWTSEYLLSPLGAESASPSPPFTATFSSSIKADFPKRNYAVFEETPGTSSDMGCSNRDLRREVENIQLLGSAALKEEMRFKIQLRRINRGEKELKVDFTSTDTTISYDAVQKRSEIRNKNKEYAKQSRERVKGLMKNLESENKRLVRKNNKLKQSITEMKEKLNSSTTILSRHHNTCRQCSTDDGICSVCYKKSVKSLTRETHSLNGHSKMPLSD